MILLSVLLITFLYDFDLIKIVLRIRRISKFWKLL